MSPHDSRVPTPRYLLRRRLVLHLLRRYPPGRFLEIGCGSAELMTRLARLGFHGVGLEISPHVVTHARERVRRYGPQLRVTDDPETLRGDRFRYVLALEVLEHIEDDAAALVRWREWLEPGGRLVVSVPARMSLWTGADEVGGHYRRYEKRALQSLLESCGYVVDVFWSYGFPLTALTVPARAFLYRARARRAHASTREQATLVSSLDSTRSAGRAATVIRPVVEGLGFGLHVLQLPFRRLDLGDGYLVACRLP